MLAKSGHEVAVTLPSDREIRFTRIFECPREVLFETWTKPEHVRHWWGCAGSTLSVCEIDLREGGAWHFVLRMADGSEHPFKGVYREIHSPERLVYTECYDVAAIGSPQWLTTVAFEEHEGMTKLTSTILHQSIEARDGHLKSGMEAGMVQTLNVLAELAAQMAQTRLSSNRA